MPQTTRIKDVQRRIRRVQKLALWMDDQFRVPGTRIRFGLDSLVGLIPGAGDLATAAVGVWVIAEAVRLRLPKRVLVRMLANLGIDALVGAIPILGDLFDVYWKSNRRNVELIERSLENRLGAEQAITS